MSIWGRILAKMQTVIHVAMVTMVVIALKITIIELGVKKVQSGFVIRVADKVESEYV